MNTTVQVAPKVTKEDIEAGIEHEFYYIDNESIAASDKEAMIQRFLSWKLPASVTPDGTPGSENRTGTNLLSYPEAKAMIDHITSTVNLPPETGRTTHCMLVMKNGFCVTGMSACVNKENFNKEEGRKWARAEAFNKLWELFGWEMKNRLTGTNFDIKDLENKNVLPTDDAAE